MVKQKQKRDLLSTKQHNTLNSQRSIRYQTIDITVKDLIDILNIVDRIEKNISSIRSMVGSIIDRSVNNNVKR